jgi:hypothetical protein
LGVGFGSGDCWDALPTNRPSFDAVLLRLETMRSLNLASPAAAAAASPAPSVPATPSPVRLK